MLSCHVCSFLQMGPIIIQVKGQQRLSKFNNKGLIEDEFFLLRCMFSIRVLIENFQFDKKPHSICHSFTRSKFPW